MLDVLLRSSALIMGVEWLSISETGVPTAIAICSDCTEKKTPNKCACITRTLSDRTNRSVAKSETPSHKRNHDTAKQRILRNTVVDRRILWWQTSTRRREATGSKELADTSVEFRHRPPTTHLAYFAYLGGGPASMYTVTLRWNKTRRSGGTKQGAKYTIRTHSYRQINWRCANRLTDTGSPTRQKLLTGCLSGAFLPGASSCL